MTGLVIEAMRNMLPAAIGCFVSRSITPWATWCATLPRRPTMLTAPASSPAPMRRSSILVIRCSRSDDRPTSSGLAVEFAVMAGNVSATTNKAHKTTRMIRFLLASGFRLWRRRQRQRLTTAAGLWPP